MMVRLIGFLCVAAGAAASGFGIASEVKKQCVFYRRLLDALEFLRTEIEFHLTPLRDICNQLSGMVGKPLDVIFHEVGNSLSDAAGRPAGVLMRRAILNQGTGLPKAGREVMEGLFDVLGKQDVIAQVRAVDLSIERTKSALNQLEKEKQDRCRTYRTIGICAGLAVAVILL